ncbi:hypothetical protein BJX61DRAFT_538994 [Aspergillus egyptiacus]|nr:hypothetical protein BJX61DRAFT_538994 [Aspergillus egyptiacus]
MTLWHLVLITLFTVPGVSAQGWEDFANNFATDLAPLVALFGERLAKQFLAESTTLLDNFIFALSPLGILTAVVSVIRICGNSSLRAFVGRANEPPGEAENELLSCVSDGTAELFHNGGISRVPGRPRILEVVVWEGEPDPCGQKKTYKLGTLRDALRDGAWSMEGGAQDEKDFFSLPESDIPNLSLNKGIKKRGLGWFCLAALVGIALQGGTLVYSGLTVFWYQDYFREDGEPADSYAFPLYIYGSVSLNLGMFLCAFLIERSSIESHLHSVKPSKIYWLQPGRQTIGEQDFGAFLAVNESPNSQPKQNLTYVKSIRGPVPKRKGALLVSTISMTMLGFILQFVGLRGLHPSVIIANVGSTLLMAVVRTCLRAKRIGSDENKFKEEDREMTSHKQQELDFFAFQLEEVESFRLVSSPVHQTRSRSGSCSTSDSSIVSTRSLGLGSRLIQTRAKLADLTSCTRHPALDWDDLPIRKVAQDLASTIGMTMEVISRWKEVPGNTCSFELSYACQAVSHKSTGSALETYPIKLKRSNDTFQWTVDTHELEAILGLWTFSLLKSNPKNWLYSALGRAVGLTKSEASAETTDLYFNKWIYRQREAQMVSSKMISFSEQAFGYYSDKYLDDKDILVVKTENKLEVMAAQDIYIQFLMSILAGLDSLGGDVKMVRRSQNSFLAESTDLNELVRCFESGHLGSREDALLCIVPVLRHRGLLPELTADSSSVRARVRELVLSGGWSEALSMLRWLCERCEGEEFERSVYEFGLLCQRAMFDRDASIRQKGVEGVVFLLGCDIRSRFIMSFKSSRPPNWLDSNPRREWLADFSNQLGWMAWHVANSRPEWQAMRVPLKSLGYSEDLILRGTRNGDDNAIFAQRTFLEWVVFRLYDPGPHGIAPNYDEACAEACIDWILRNNQGALCYWLLAKWAESSSFHPQLAMKAYVFAAKRASDLMMQMLQRHGVSINVAGDDGTTALIQAVLVEDAEACTRLLGHGADVEVSAKDSKITPLILAAGQGNEKISALLLQHGAELEARDVVGFTALNMACKENQPKTAKLLLERGTDLEATTNDGRTPLSYAVAGGYVEVVRLLVERGADIEAQDHYGRTPLDRAMDSGDKDIIAIMKAASTV